MVQNDTDTNTSSTFKDQKYLKLELSILVIFALLLATLVFIILLSYLSSYTSKIDYEQRLFDDSYVHQIDLEVKDFDEMIANCIQELYYPCNIIIDGERFNNVGIRAKGNNSMQNVVVGGTNRHSFKIEFDQYIDENTYYGLDKLVLNNIIFDNTYMKEYIVYKLLNDIGGDSPLCSYSFINVNGEPWGLYMSIESIEDSFVERTHPGQHGKLYKPDTPELEDIAEFKDARGYTVIPDDYDWNTPDVRLNYIDDKVSSYPSLFEVIREKAGTSNADRYRLISSLRVLNNPRSTESELEEILDVDSLTKFFAMHNFIYNDDSYTGSLVHNYYLYEYNGKLSMFPWDYSLGFGCYNTDVNNPSLVINDPIDTPIEVGLEQGKHPMFTWITDSAEFRQQYHKEMQNIISNAQEIDIDAIYEMLKPYIKQEKVRFCTPEEVEIAIQNLKLFMELRTESVQRQLDGLISTMRDERSQSDNLVDASNLDLVALGYLDRGN